MRLFFFCKKEKPAPFGKRLKDQHLLLVFRVAVVFGTADTLLCFGVAFFE